MRKKITALLMAAIFAIGSAGSAQATIIHKDEWETIYIDSVHLSNDVCTVKRNPKKIYSTGCTYSDSSYDAVSISGYVSTDGTTLKTTITSSVSKYRSPGDSQVVTAITANADARFSLKITCTSGTAVNRGSIIWFEN